MIYISFGLFSQIWIDNRYLTIWRILFFVSTYFKVLIQEAGCVQAKFWGIALHLSLLYLLTRCNGAQLVAETTQTTMKLRQNRERKLDCVGLLKTDPCKFPTSQAYIILHCFWFRVYPCGILHYKSCIRETLNLLTCANSSTDKK